MVQKTFSIHVFQKHHQKVKKRLQKKHTSVKRFLHKHTFDFDKIRSHSAKLLTGATLGSSLLLSAPVFTPLIPPKTVMVAPYASPSEFMSYVDTVSKQETMTSAQEALMCQGIEKYFGIPVQVDLDGHRLPDYFGSMGLEQHLYRSAHDDLPLHTAFQKAGIAPNRGAFGYFAENDKSYEQMVDEERYYIVLQTFLLSSWAKDWNTLKAWYKFRKFLVLNTATGKAVVTVLGDAGPATWTGKKFGGSPEVMYSLGLYPRKTKGNVVVLFIDEKGADPIPLGPVAQKI